MDSAEPIQMSLTGLEHTTPDLSTLVRAVQARDEAAVIDLGRMMHQESEYKHMRYSPSRVAHVISDCVAMPTVWFGRVLVNKDDRPVGFMCAYTTMGFFSTDLVAHDCALYITQPYRKLDNAVKMIAAYREWAQSVHASLAFLDATAVLDARIGMLFHKLGFKYAGTVHRWSKHDG